MTGEEPKKQTPQESFWSDVPMGLRWLATFGGIGVGLITGYPFAYIFWLGLTWG